MQYQHSTPVGGRVSANLHTLNPSRPNLAGEAYLPSPLADRILGAQSPNHLHPVAAPTWNEQLPMPPMDPMMQSAVFSPQHSFLHQPIPVPAQPIMYSEPGLRPRVAPSAAHFLANVAQQPKANFELDVLSRKVTQLRDEVTATKERKNTIEIDNAVLQSQVEVAQFNLNETKAVADGTLYIMI